MKKNAAYTLAIVLVIFAISVGVGFALWAMHCDTYLAENPTAVYVPIPGTSLSLPENVQLSSDWAFHYMIFLTLFCSVYIPSTKRGRMSRVEFADRAIFCSGLTFSAAVYFYSHTNLEVINLPTICSAIVLLYFGGRMFLADETGLLDKRSVNLVSLLAACIATGSTVKQTIPLSLVVTLWALMLIVFIVDVWHLIVVPAWNSRRSTV